MSGIQYQRLGRKENFDFCYCTYIPSLLRENFVLAELLYTHYAQAGPFRP